ncbi:MAG: metallophosphoesterase family protein [Promethearchaeota archaeon]
MENISKLAIISDIHANKYALNRFLDYINENFHVEKILNLGDFVHIAPHPKEVTQIIFDDNRFENIIGNNEMIILGKHKTPHRVEPHSEWTKNQLKQGLMTKIQDTPTFKILNINEKRILMLHSHFYDIPGRSVQDNLLLYQGKTLEEFLNDYPNDIDIVLVGHSHEQLYISWEGKKIINPGSVSINWAPRVSFCLIELDSDNINIIFKNIPYDISKLKADYEQRNVPHREFLVKYFYPFL